MTNALPGPVRMLSRAVRRPYNSLAGLGHQATFVARAMGSIPLTMRYYSGEVFRLLGDICWGKIGRAHV